MDIVREAQELILEWMELVEWTDANQDKRCELSMRSKKWEAEAFGHANNP